MAYQANHVKILSEREFVSNLQCAASRYNELVDKDVLFIYKNKDNMYDFYQMYFGRDNFMHLAGVKRTKEMKAVNFYDKCLSGTIALRECKPKHNIANMHEKVSVIHKLLDYRNCKCYKAGNKDLITRYDDFEFAIGNDRGLIGYADEVSGNGIYKVNPNHLPIPYTLIPNNMKQYCTETSKIMFVLRKESTEDNYKKLYYEIKKDIFLKERELFSESLKKLLNNEPNTNLTTM